MSKIFYLLLLPTIAACNGQAGNHHPAGKAAAAKEVVPPYRPGLGEFMESVQVHHNKLWFAGINRNWPLAGFEREEINEILDDIRKYCPERPEIGKLPMLNVALDSIGLAIGAGDKAAFTRGFTALTASCNNCHTATAHAFNVIVIPDHPPFSNQDFRPRQKLR